MAIYRQTFTYRDAKGQTSTLKVNITSDTTAHAETYAAGLETVLSACTNAALQSAHGPKEVQNALTFGASTAGELAISIEDKLALYGACGTQKWRMSIPAPLESQFLADGETPDVAATELAALIAYLITPINTAVVCSPAGTALASVYGAQRLRSKVRRRFSMTTKDPALSGPAL